MNDAELQKIKNSLSSPKSPLYGSDLVPLIADLIEENEFLCSQEPCPKCGYGVTASCYGCEIKRLKRCLQEIANPIEYLSLDLNLKKSNMTLQQWAKAVQNDKLRWDKGYLIIEAE